MKDQQIRRRDFLSAAAAGTAGIVLGGPAAASAAEPKPLKIEEPFHGAVLNRRHGKQVPDGLKILVTGDAPRGRQVTVNESPAGRAATTSAGPRC